ncbi:MAG: adenylate kinase [Cryobacterium sp.]|nr:adenylate kinase [Oligoflexia bacterium]
MILIFLGPPGSGKGTQAKRLMSHRSWPQLSTGDMLRASISKGSALGMEAKKYMDQGHLVPDLVVVGMIAERIQEPDCRSGFILDGFPRTLPQAKSLDVMLAARNLSVDVVVEFQIKDSELLGRLSGRRTCSKCGTLYHIHTSPPQVSGICDVCGSDVIQRADDQESVIQKRLKVYHELTAPLVRFYSEQGKLRAIDASVSMAAVDVSVHDALGIA